MKILTRILHNPSLRCFGLCFEEQEGDVQNAVKWEHLLLTQLELYRATTVHNDVTHPILHSAIWKFIIDLS